MMKKFFLLLFVSTILNAQTFTVTVDDTTKSDTLNSEIVFTFTLKNVSSEEQTIDIIRTENNLPEGWSSSLCFSLCFAPTVDSISTTRDYGSSPLGAGEQREFTFHVFPRDNNGTGKITLKIKNANQQNEVSVFGLTANAGITDVGKSKVIAEDYYLTNNFPNPFNPTTNIEYKVAQAGKVKIILYNSLGKFIKQIKNEYKTEGKYKLKIDMNDYSSGVYFVKYSVNNFYAIKKIILEK